MSKGKGWKEAMDNWTGLGGHFGQAEKRLKQIGIEEYAMSMWLISILTKGSIIFVTVPKK